MDTWTSGIIIGFVAGGVLAYFVGHFIGYDKGIKRGLDIVCDWLLANAKACEIAASAGLYPKDNNMEAQTIRTYIEHIEQYNEK